MRLNGFTLLEMMVSITILTLVGGALYVLSFNLAQAARIQETKTTTADDAQNAMLFLERELRQAATSSINWAGLPGQQLRYRVATDVDGNGTAVDASGFLELSGVRTIGRDTNDLNNDGLTLTQLIWTDGVNVRVIANGLALNEDLNNNGVLDPGEDRNSNGRLERGIWFAPANPGMVVTVQTERMADAQGTRMVSEVREVLVPRN